jgi:hypothetical protein
MSIRRVAILSLSVAACGGDGGGTGIELPSGPTIAECGPSELPLVEGGCERVGLPAECWDRWTPAADGGCEPILPAGACPDDTLPILGDTTCQPIQDCGTGPWGNVDRLAGAVHVDASYAGGDSDGTAAKPYVQLLAAVDQAPFGGQIVLAAGSYAGGVVVNRTLRIEGRCPALVTLSANGYGFGVTGPDVTIRGITVTGAGSGLQLQGGGTLVENVVLEDLDEDGAIATFGGTATLRRVRVSRTTGAGIAVYGSPVVVEEVLVEDVRARADGDLGMGFLVASQLPGGDPGHLTLTRSIVQRTRMAGVSLLESAAMLDEVVVRDVEPRVRDGSRGVGLDVESDVYTASPSDVQLRRSLIAGARHAGVLVQGSTARIEQTQVRDTASASLGLLQSAGFGIWAFSDPLNRIPSNLTLLDSSIAGNRHAGVWISSSTATVESTWIRDTRSEESEQTWGVGLLASEDRNLAGAELDVRRALVTGNRQAGILIAASTASLEDVAVLDTASIERGPTGGRGIALQGSILSGAVARVAVTRAVMRRNREAGIFACGATASLQDVVVLETSANGDGRFGDGIVAGRCGPDAAVDVANAWVEGADRAGVSYFGTAGSIGAVVTGADVAVALESGAAPALDAANVYAGNEHDEALEDQGLEALPALPVVAQ